MPQHILCVSYDDRLLTTRRRVLEGEGYSVTTALGFKESLARCEDGGFDLFVLGHSIPHSDKQNLMNKFRQISDAPILALWHPREPVLDTANYLAFSDNPAEFLKAVGVILTRKSSA
jgi:CheY-like chemotaxis protein